MKAFLVESEECHWQEQMREAIKTPQDLQNYFFLSPSLNHLTHLTQYPLFIPKPLAQLIKEKGPSSPLWKQFIPHPDEENPQLQHQGLKDPIGDKAHAQPGQIIHRYQNRILFTPTAVCPVTCRYCFRKNELIPGEQDQLFRANFEATLRYLREHPEIEEIIFSGGDPLILSNSKLHFYLESFAKIKSVKYIRFHTRTPIIIPQRITESFLKLLKSFQSAFKKVQVVVHINHQEELYPEVRAALAEFYRHRLDLLSQTVLLKGVNDSVEALTGLFSTLVDLDVRPYYLHHPDKVKGGLHFFVTLEEGRKLYGHLRDRLPGWAIPHYMVDIPGGEGKVWAFNPESYEFQGRLINRKGEMVPYLGIPGKEESNSQKY